MVLIYYSFNCAFKTSVNLTVKLHTALPKLFYFLISGGSFIINGRFWRKIGNSLKYSLVNCLLKSLS